MIDGNAFVRSRLAGYVEELSQFARIPSVSTQDTGIRAAVDWLVRALERRGVTVDVVETPGNPVLLGTIGGGERSVLLYNHYDVQPAEPLSAWTSPPFEPELRDGKLYARGVMDDKGEIVARLAALDLLREHYGDALPLRLVFCVEGEEERGSPNLGAFIAKHRERLRADACIWEAGQVDDEGRPQIWLGVRGLLYVELTATTMSHDAHSGWAHALPSAAWRLIAALGTLRDDGGRVTIDGFNDDVADPTARQRELLAGMPDETATYRREYGVQSFVGGKEGLALREMVFQPTCNISGIWSGHIETGSKTVIPAQARARIDFRLVPGQDPQRCFQALQQHLARRGFGDIEVRATEEGQFAACSNPDHPFIRTTIEVLREHYGLEPLVSPMVGGTGPAAHIVRQLGIPFASIGCSYPSSRKHAPDENIRLDDFVRGSVAIADVLDRFARIGSVTEALPA